jgi:hypothetical protein
MQNYSSENLIFQTIKEGKEANIVFKENIEAEVWDRKDLYITSSLAQSSDANAYFCHTRPVSIVPIKYYRLDSDDKEFWIEIYSTSDHTVDVNNITRWSDVHIETIFMYSTNAMI